MAEPKQEELIEAIRNADAAGDYEAAQRLTQYHDRLYSPPEPTPEPEQSQFDQQAAQGIGAPFNRGPRQFKSIPEPVDAVSGATRKPTDDFTTATGKALGNVPERFQQSYGGLVQMLGEDMSQARQERIATTSQRLGITPQDYKLLAWAGNEGLIDPDMEVPEALDYVKQNIATSLNDEQIAQVADYGIINPEELAQYGRGVREQAAEEMEPIQAEPGSAAYYGSAAIGSVAEMGPALAAGILTRNPQVTMSLMGGQVAGQSYGQARDEGLSPDEAQVYSAANAAAEAIPEYIPVATLLKRGKGFLSRVLSTAGAEGATETLTAALQIGIDQQMIDPDMSWQEARQRLVDGGIIGTLAGGGMAVGAQPMISAQEAAQSPERQIGREMLRQSQQEPQGQAPEQVARESLQPTMADRVNRKLQERGIDPASVDLAGIFAPRQQAMPEDVNVPVEAPQVDYGVGMERVQHKTGRNKLLTGVVDTQIDEQQAREIDPYTFKKDGGWFIRDERIEQFNQQQPVATSDQQQSDQPVRSEPATTVRQPDAERVQRGGRDNVPDRVEPPVRQAEPIPDAEPVTTQGVKEVTTTTGKPFASESSANANSEVKTAKRQGYQVEMVKRDNGVVARIESDDSRKQRFREVALNAVREMGRNYQSDYGVALRQYELPRKLIDELGDGVNMTDVTEAVSVDELKQAFSESQQEAQGEQETQEEQTNRKIANREPVDVEQAESVTKGRSVYNPGDIELAKATDQKVKPEGKGFDTLAEINNAARSGSVPKSMQSVSAESIQEARENKGESKKLMQEIGLPDEMAQVLSSQVNEILKQNKSFSGEQPKTTVTKAGISIEVPTIDVELIDKMNRSTYMGKGRDLNAELESVASNYIDELEAAKYTLESEEQREAAQKLGQKYIEDYAEFMRWDAQYSAGNPSWFVTGRSGRSSAKQNSKNERHADAHRERFEKLEKQYKRIFERLYSMRPADVKQKQAFNKHAEDIGLYVGELDKLTSEGKEALAKDNRKWMSPKIYKAIVDMREFSEADTESAIVALDNNVDNKLVELVGSRSKAGKAIKEILTDEPQQPPEVSNYVSNLGVDQPGENWQPMFSTMGVPMRPESGVISVGDRTVKLNQEDNPTRREGIRTMLKDIIGPRLYQGKIKGQSKLGFYRRNNSEVRVSRYDDVEVMAHEMAHYLDFHYKFKNKFSELYSKPEFVEQVKALSYTDNKKVIKSEGFAEFVRLWLTQYDKAAALAPEFTAAFEKQIAKDDRLAKKMRSLQDEMHKWYNQGPLAQLRAKSGKELTQSQQLVDYFQRYPLENFRQEAIDKVHAAKVIERTISGEIKDASVSPYKQFQMVNGAESIHESVIRDGTPSLKDDGSFEFSGKGLAEIFRPAARHGYKRFDLLMDYFKARRAQELMRQGRENLFTTQEIDAGLGLAQKYPEFESVFEEYQAFNGRMLDFYEQMGLIESKQREAFAEMNKNYVPFHRVIERLEDGDQAGVSQIGQRLTGGSQNVKDVAENIIDGLAANIRGATIARAKQTLYKDIMASQDGAIFAAKISPDAKPVRVQLSQMADKIASIMADSGLTVNEDGNIVSAAPGEVLDMSSLSDRLESNTDLLTFWNYGQPPSTLETYVDSAVIDGKRVWFEVNSPLLVNMLTGLRGLKSGAVLNGLFRVKNIQTRTVTSMLQFLGPNAIRDTVSSFVISKNKFIPVYSTLRGMGDAIFNTEVYKQFRQQGAAYGTRIEARTEETRSRRQLDLPSRNLWDIAAKLAAGYDRFASAFEYGSRIGDYRAAIKSGKNPLEAAWEAREVATDFSKIGRNELWAKFLRTVPFMNAGVQGLDKTAREIFEMQGEMKGSNFVRVNNAKLRFLAAGGTLTLMTMILWMLNKDDERYQGLTADQKARFWWIFPPGADRPIKIPRPYDVGHIFATIPEVALDYVAERDGKEAAEALAWTFANTLGIGDYPGILQPIIEVARNEKFTGAPVVPYQLMNVPNEYQFTDRTPIMYRKLGELLGASPVVAEHLTKGYLRYVEDYISDATEAYFWDKEKWGERPFNDAGPIDYLTYQFQGQRVPYRTKWVEGYYELKQKAAGIRSAYSQLMAQAVRDDKPIKDFASNEVNQLLIGMDKAFSQIDSAFKDQDAALASIRYNPKLSKEEKEKQIESWYEQKNRALSKFYQRASVALEEAQEKMP